MGAKWMIIVEKIGNVGLFSYCVFASDGDGPAPDSAGQ
jgi:hypothetical protein